MCGISGCVFPNKKSPQLDELRAFFIEALHHRGPDGNDYWFDRDNHILLCHNRLAVIDLSISGQQPMISASKRYIITFNGEIYNFQALRHELSQKGYRFMGGSDTEVMLAGFEEWGVRQALVRFNGMFAFAVWDSIDKTLTLARDRLGEKPLYYGWLADGFVFASELKAIKKVNNGLSINEGIVPDYLNFGYIPTPYTIYQKIYKLTPGTVLTFCKDHLKSMPGDFNPQSSTHGLSPSPYWSLTSEFEEQNEFLISDPGEAVRQLEQILKGAVQRQLIADVPVGAFLSGGVDSSAVVALMQHVSTLPVRTFTIGFNVEQFNEAEFAKKIAKHLGTEHTEFYLNPNDCLDLIERLPVIYDEPFADPSQLPTTLVCELARKQVTVCLSGDGGDELFAGYNRYLSTKSLLQKTSFLPPYFKRVLTKLLLSFDSTAADSCYEILQKFILGGKAKQANIGLKLYKMGKLLEMNDVGDIYSFLLKLNRFNSNSSLSPNKVIDKRIAQCFTRQRQFVDIAMLIDQLNYLPDDNLTKVDRAGMSCALETRVPILDKEVVELSWRIPWQIKIKNGQSKWPLRQVLYKYVPRKLIERPKMGFSVPVSAWIRKELKDWSYALIQNLDVIPIANRGYWQGLWDEHQTGTKDNGLALWPALMLSLWLQADKR